MIPKLYFPSTRDLPDSHIQRALDGLLNLIYPDRCFICSTPVARRHDCGICAGCWSKATALKIVPPRCSSCGLPFQGFEDISERLCGHCILDAPPYSGARSYGHYRAELSSLIHGLKFHARRHLVGLLAPLLAEIFFDNWDRGDFDMVIPVPLHSRRKRERGYNQSELLARSLAHKIALPYHSPLRRIRSTLPQVGLTDFQRQENVRRAFICPKPDEIFKKRILLVDDVMTTGATVSSAAQTLKDGGALRVSVLTVARVGKG